MDTVKGLESHDEAPGGAAIMMLAAPRTVSFALALLVTVPALALASIRVLLEDHFDAMVRALPVIPRTLVLAGMANLVLAALAVFLSSLTPRRIYAQASFTLLLFITFAISYPLAHQMRSVNLRLLSVRDAVEGLGYGMFKKWAFDRSWMPSWQGSLTMLLIMFGGAALALFIRIRRVELSSLGT